MPLSKHPALQYLLLDRDAHSSGVTRMYSDVAVVASDQSLSMACGHLLDPGRDRLTAMPLEVLQVAHVVNLHAVMRAAQLTCIR
jgi:hypothetical protein